jgi:diguanylate cyclase (GGDEF)-like protein
MRDRLAHMLGIHPRQLKLMEPELASAITTHLNQANRRIQRLVDQGAVDELTGALRRSAGLEALEREIHRTRRLGDAGLVVAFIDVDHLKEVNDTAGHAAGDLLLQEVSRTLRSRLRAYDLVIRWGGDEFLCVLPEAGLKGASRIMDEVAAEFEANSGYLFSVGFAELRDGETAAEMIARADSQLYAQRRERRSGGRGPGRGSKAKRRRWLSSLAGLLGLLCLLAAGMVAATAGR